MSNSVFKSPHRGTAAFAGAGIPARKVVTLRWGFGPATAAVSSSYGESIFSGCDILDPGLTLSSIRPLGFAEMALWYNNYRALSSTIKIECSTVSTSTTPTATAIETSWVLYANGSTSSPSTFGSAIAQTGALFKKSELGKPCTFTMSGSLKQVLGVAGIGYDASSALVNASPTATYNWHLGSQSPAAYTSVVSQIQVLIEFKVEFFNRKLLELSLMEEKFAQFAEKSLLFVLASGSKEKKFTLRTDACEIKTEKDVNESKERTGLKTESILPPASPAVSDLSQSTILGLTRDLSRWVKLEQPSGK